MKHKKLQGTVKIILIMEVTYKYHHESQSKRKILSLIQLQITYYLGENVVIVSVSDGFNPPVQARMELNVELAP